VGLACKILPHNFIELIDASIGHIRGRKVDIVPDFLTGGSADFSNYNGGLRGGKVRVRAKIRQEDKKTLIISEIPFGTTTSSLIESIIKANDKGKIKMKKIEDNTAEFVEIILQLPPNTSPDNTIDALYAFTDCEMSISPNACIIEDDTPKFISVNEMLKISTNLTVKLSQMELEIKRNELESHWHFTSLEKIFIENRIYRDIEECETWEAVIEAIYKGLKPHLKKLKREITDEDVVRLTEIRIKRISKFDGFKADELLLRIEDQLKEVNHHLDNLKDYVVAYFKELKKKYGEGKERRTEIKSFETIVASKVAVANIKLYINREDGFAGYGLRRDEFVCDCSDIDSIIVIRKDGVMIVSKITDKAFFGKNILHIGIWKKGDDRTIYNIVYQDGKAGNIMMKRCAVTSITRDKEYPLTKGKEHSKILYFSANPNGETEIIRVVLKAQAKLKKLKYNIDFADLAIKGRGASGNILSKHAVSKIYLKEQGASSLGAIKIWFDDTVQRLNTEERGELLGEFSGEDKILTVMQSGSFQLCSFDLSTHFEEDMIIIEKWIPEKPLSAVYYDGDKKEYFVKRFLIEGGYKKIGFISDHTESYLEILSVNLKPKIDITFSKVKGKEFDNEIVQLEEFIGIKGFKALGNRLSTKKIRGIDLIPLTEEEEVKDLEEIQKMIPVEPEVKVEEEEGLGLDVEDSTPGKDEISKEADNEEPKKSSVLKNLKKKSLNDEDQFKMEF
ncbi:MAG: DNA gyrase/topoisomerase IV subunit A, partial [Flavobacteriales bacterium]|nr:DNA gyrase/topoisomerase IV subunit A [Flavobacteriales bacterium]